jgi:hypothetical protein
MSTTLVELTITAENTFTDAVALEGYFNLSLSGTITAGTTVTVQRSIDNTNWKDVDTFTKATEDYGFEPEKMWYRVGVKTGDLAGGDSVIVRLGREFKDRH